MASGSTSAGVQTSVKSKRTANKQSWAGFIQNHNFSKSLLSSLVKVDYQDAKEYPESRLYMRLARVIKDEDDDCIADIVDALTQNTNEETHQILTLPEERYEESIFFVFSSNTPFKFTLKVPRGKSPLHRREVRELCGQQNLTLPYKVPPGEFHSIVEKVYILVFSETQPCSSVHSEFHTNLPQERIEIVQDLIKRRSKIGAAASYRYQRSEYRTVNYDEQFIKCLSFEEQGDNRNESQRTDAMMLSISEWIKEQGKDHLFTIEKYYPNTDSYCQFTGGGDINIFFDNSAITFVTRLEGDSHSSSEDRDPPDSPMSPGELRTSCIIENKVQKASHVGKQLKANMVLVAVSAFIKQMASVHREGKSCYNFASSIQSVSSYGISFGLMINFEFLKLEIDLEKNVMDFTRKAGPFSGDLSIFAFDCALDYVLNNLK